MTRLVEAHWAVESKHPGDEADYRILDYGPGDVALLGRYLHENAPGSPTTESESRDDSLPWAAVGCHGGDRPWLSLSVMRWSGHRDRDHRAVATTTLAVVAHEVLVGIGYLAWARALERADLPGHGVALQLELDDAPVQPETDLRWAAGVAALLLDGRVVIAGAGGDMGSRLALVDSVATMLPEGCRGDLGFTTWAVDPDRRPHRLCFAEHGTTSVAVEVRPFREPLAPGGAAARRYLEIVRAHLDEGRGDDLRHWLAAASAPLSLDDPDAALDVAYEFDLPRHVEAEVRAGQGRPDAARRALRRGVDVFSRGSLGGVFACALVDADPGELEELTRLWSPELRGAVAETARDGRRARAVLPAFVDVARRVGDADVLLVEALGRPGTADPDTSELAVEILAQQGWPDWPLLHRRIGEDLDVVGVLAYRVEPGGLLSGLLDWLTTGHDTVATWALVLRDLATGTPDGRAPVADPLERLGAGDPRAPGVAATMFVVAARHGRLADLPESVWPAVASLLGRSSRIDRAPLVRVLQVPGHADVIAHLDALRCTADVTFPAGRVADAESYVRTLIDVARRLRSTAGGDELVGAVLDRRLDASPTTADRAVLLLAAGDAVDPDRYRATARRSLGQDDGELVALLDARRPTWAHDGDLAWWADLARLRGFVRAGMPPATTAPVLARVLGTEPEAGRGRWANALTSGAGQVPVDRLVRTVLDTSARLIDEYQSDPGRVDAWTADVLDAVRRGEFGAAAAAGLPAVLDAELLRAESTDPERDRLETEIRRVRDQIRHLESVVAGHQARQRALDARRRATAHLLRSAREPVSEEMTAVAGATPRPPLYARIWRST